MMIFLNKKKKMQREKSVHKKPNATLSSDDPHLIRIRLPQPKIRVKFPKLLRESMQRRNHRCSNESNVDQEEAKTGLKHGDFLRKRIGFVILNACGSRNAQQMCSSGDQPMEKTVAGQEIKFSKSHDACDEILETKESTGLEEKVHGEKSSAVDEKPVKMPTKLSRFIRNRMGFQFHFKKWKFDEKSNGGASQRNCSKNLDEFQSLKCIPEKGMIIKDGAEEERSEMELCKKRILMGEKCRPLNLSGALHYDEDGVLLFEQVLPCQEW